MKTVMVLTIVQWFCAFSYGFVLPLDTVLNKTVALSGNQIFSIDQDVIFKFGSADYVIKENWLIEGDKNLKLVATGQGPLKDLFRLVVIYNSKSKTVMFGKNKHSELVLSDFFERYLSIRSIDSFKNYLKWLSIAPLMRLSRADGSTAFAIGEPSDPDIGKPQLWIDQDTFQIRKLRFLSEAEVSFEDYAVYGKKISIPRTKKVSWGDHSILIKVRNVSTKTGASLSSFYPQTLNQPSEDLLASKGGIGLVIQDFYKRFR